MKKYIALFLVFCMVITIAPTQVIALEQATVSAGYETATPGKNAIVCVDASNFKNIAGLTLSVFYSTNALRVVNATAGDILSGTISSVNSKTPGEITLSVVSQDAIGENGTLLIIEFQVLGDCEAGTYPIGIAVSEAYTTSLQIAAIQTLNGSVTVEKRADAPAAFEILSTTDRNEVHYGDSFRYSVASGNSAPFASCDFIVEYDPDALEYNGVQLSDGLTVDGATYSIHAQTPGVVRISYASDTSVSSDSLFTVKFTVCTATDSDTTITTRAQNIYRDDLTAYYPCSCEVSVKLLAQPEIMDYPNVYLNSGTFVVGEECTSDFVLEEGAGVAAADFVLYYDPAVLQCVNVKAASGVSSLGGMIVINDNYSSGEIHFSYINTKGYAATDIPMITITWIPLYSSEQHYEIRSSGTGIVDLNYATLTLEHQTDSACIYQKKVVSATCETNGYTEYSCGCGERVIADPVDALGHEFLAYSVDEDGIKIAVCSRPGCGEAHTLTPVSLEITTLPDKLYYQLGEVLDLTGMVVTVGYDDGTTEIVTNYSVSGFRDTPGDHTIIITYGKCKASFVVQVLGYGDCNDDGMVDYLDLECLRNYLAGRDPVTLLSTVEIGSGADYNGDGVINGVDLAMLRAYLAGIGEKE